MHRPNAREDHERQRRIHRRHWAVKQLPEKPDNDTLLKLYALYKQGSEGDVSGDKPGFLRLCRRWPNTRPGNKCRAPARSRPIGQYIELVRTLGAR